MSRRSRGRPPAERSAGECLDELERGASPGAEACLIEELAIRPLDPEETARYHDALLLTLAYPRSEAGWRHARGELAGFEQRIAAMEPEERERLADTGIVATPQCYPYDLANARWFASLDGCRVEIDWSLVEPGARRRLAALVEGLLGRSPLSTGVRKTLESLRGAGTCFDWLSRRLARAAPDADDILFNACDLPLRLDLSAGGPCRTLNRFRPPRRPALFDPVAARAAFDVVAEIRRPIDFGRPMSRRRGAELLGAVRGLVLSRGRELHAMTHGNPDEVYHARLDRGASIAVWMMNPRERLPLEVGWYFAMFRNGVPLAYGGGGLLHRRAEIGMNLFDPYRRSGEAGWIFAQIARAACSFCPAPWIVTRRYQFGGDDNDEGIASGAYWFYDKLGFRSVDPAVRAVADRERRRRASDPRHRSSRATLRRLARADAVLSLDGRPPEAYREYASDRIGLRLAGAIAGRFGSDRSGLERWLDGIGPRRRAGDPYRRRQRDTALFQLITDRSLLAEARRAARLKGGRWEGRYAAAMPALREWLEHLAVEELP